MRTIILSALALAVAVAWIGPAAAQDAPAGEAVVYGADYFARFKPQTAYDIALVVPGFALEEMTQARGLLASAGNVLVDGQRPTAKSGGLQEVLSRIPAASVVRVEVSRGGPARAEAAGQALFVNIVRARAVSSGTWLVQVERPTEPVLNGRAEGAITRRIGDWDLTGKVNGYWQQRNYLYYRRTTVGADGGLRQFQLEDAPAERGEAYMSAEAKGLIGGGALTLTGRFGRDVSFRQRNRENRASLELDNLPATQQQIGDDLTRLVGEGGIEWVRERPTGWTLRLAGLSSWIDSEQAQVSESGPFGAPAASRSSFANDQTALEMVARGSLSRSGRLSPEAGLEVAFNQLDSVVTAGQDRGGVPVVGADRREETIVEETRAEVFANLKWAASERLRLEGGLAVEVSEIAVSGDRTNRQDLVFFKPTASVSYSLGDGVLGRATLQRRVGQLDFADFAASASLSDDRVLAGNANLRPEQSWRAAVGLDLRSERRGALSLEAYYEAVEDVLEQAILNAQGDIGLANLGSAERWGLTARGTLPLAPVVPGARLELTVNWRDSRFDDPLTGETRTLTYFTPLTGNLGFRQDLEEAGLAWGVRAVFREQDKWYFVDERSFRYRGTTYSAFVETTWFFGLKTRLDVENIGERRNGDTREFFQPDRRAPLQSYQVSRRADGTWVKVTLSRQF